MKIVVCSVSIESKKSIRSVAIFGCCCTGISAAVFVDGCGASATALGLGKDCLEASSAFCALGFVEADFPPFRFASCAARYCRLLISKSGS